MKTLRAVHGLLWIGVATLWVLWFLRSRPQPIIDAATRAEVSSLRATRAIDSARIDSLRRSAAASASAAALAVARARAVERAATAEGHRADSLAIEARRRDSARTSPVDSSWRLAYEARTAERDSLLVSIAERDSADVKSHFTFTQLTVALDSSESRRARLEVVNTAMLKAVEKAERGCRILAIVPCPSRAQALVAGAAGGIIATVLIRH